MVTLNLEEAAALLKLHKGTLRERAASGIIPGAKPGRSWVFVEADLVKYLQDQYRPCLSTSKKAVRSGGPASTTLVNGYVGLLERQIAQRRKSAKLRLG